MWAFAASGVGVSVVAVGARVGGAGVGSASAARARSCPACGARRRVPPTVIVEEAVTESGGARRPPGRPAGGVARTGCGLAADHPDSVAHRGPALRRVPHVERPVEDVETRESNP